MDNVALPPVANKFVTPFSAAPDSTHFDAERFALEMRKLRQDFRSAKTTRRMARITATTAVLTFLLLAGGAALTFRFFQAPSVDVAKADSDRRTRIDLLKVKIDLSKSTDFENRDNFMQVIDFHLADVMTKENQEKISGPLPSTKSKPSAGDLYGYSYDYSQPISNECLTSPAAVDFFRAWAEYFRNDTSDAIGRKRIRQNRRCRTRSILGEA